MKRIFVLAFLISTPVLADGMNQPLVVDVYKSPQVDYEAYVDRDGYFGPCGGRFIEYPFGSNQCVPVNPGPSLYRDQYDRIVGGPPAPPMGVDGRQERFAWPRRR